MKLTSHTSLERASDHHSPLRRSVHVFVFLILTFLVLSLFVREVWGANQPFLVKDINQVGIGGNISNLVNVTGTLFVNGKAFFVADDGVHGSELWTSDGTEAGTVMVKDIYSDSESSYPYYLTNVVGTLNVEGTLFFQANDGTHGTELWKSDGTEAGTEMVKDIMSGSGGTYINSLTNVDGVLFFTIANGNDTELWMSDGTEAGTTIVKDIAPGTLDAVTSNLTNVNGTLFFRANDGTHGTELWQSDGSEAGTTLVKDINPSGNSDPQHLTNVNGTLYFQANDGTLGMELWQSDGTPGGTILVKDIDPAGHGSPASLTAVGNTLFFQANDGENGTELWQSDGTEGGTVQVKDINPSGDSNPSHFVNINNTLFFKAEDEINGSELWISDGTEAGTILLKDINPTNKSSNLGSLASMNSNLFFRARDANDDSELWKSNGTEASTQRVKDINTTGNSFPQMLTNVNGTLFFNANDGTTGLELWKSNGTEASTALVKDIHPSGSSYPSKFTPVNSTLFFQANDGSSGYELWKSDGTETGTRLVKDINPNGNGAPSGITNVNGTLFFQANDGSSGYEYELWKSDGTEAGTIRVKDINTTGSSYPQQLTNVNGTLFFRADDGDSGVELWKSDGTEAGTIRVKDINETGNSLPECLTNVNGILYFRADDGSSSPYPWKLWRSDGTEDGTIKVSDNSGLGYSYLNDFINVNGTLYFRANDGNSGTELWRSDGTEAGTVRVKDIITGSESGDPQYLTEVNGLLFFSADDGVNGRELWQSDGSEEGTFIVEDINLGAADSSPTNLTDINGTLYFSADNGSTGSEPWAMEITNTPPTISQIDDQNTYDHGYIGPLPFIINDLERVPAWLTIEVESDNTTILPDNVVILDGPFDPDHELIATNNIFINGSGAERTITLIPNQDALITEGSATVTITVFDGEYRAEEIFGAEWWPAKVVAKESGPGIDYGSIMLAVFEATEGELVLVRAGTYYDFGISPSANNITIRSEEGPLKTIIDGNYQQRIFYIDNSETTIDGFTIRNGYANYGGGVYFTGTSQSGEQPMITNCIFLDNNAYGGGAIYVGNGRIPTILGCIFEGNTAGDGGAVFVGIGKLIARSSSFSFNKSTEGGAIYIGLDGSVAISQSAFIKNSAILRGGAIRSASFEGGYEVENSTFIANHAGDNGGAIYAAYDGGEISHCSLARNSADLGGALFLGGDVSINNSILWGNTADESGSQIYVHDPSGSGKFVMIYGSIILEGGMAEVEGSYTFALMPDSEIIDLDPRFGLEEDLRLLAGSPAIDRGSVGLTVDFDGNLRPVDGNGDGIDAVDLGAHEFQVQQGEKSLAVSPHQIEFRGMEFQASETSSVPGSQQVILRNRNDGLLDWRIRISEETPWLRVEPSNGVISEGESKSLSFYLNSEIFLQLSSDIYRAEVIVESASGETEYRRIPVSLLVSKVLRVSSSSEYSTIRDAVVAASNEDVILIAADTYTGIYNKNINVRGKSITIASESGPEFTVIDCQDTPQDSSIVFIYNMPHRYRSAIQGLTFTNCTGSGSSGGALVFSHYGETDIQDCIFRTNNARSGYGGALFLSNAADIRISNSLFESNDAPRGGAIYAYRSDNLLIQNSTFLNNYLTPGNSVGYGGGVYINSFEGESIAVNNCQFVNNNQDPSVVIGPDYHGGGLYGSGGELTVSSCLFTGNKSEQGGGFYSISSSSIVNTIFAENEANEGGGVYYSGILTNPSSITNSVFYQNVASTDGDSILNFNNPLTSVVNSILIQDGDAISPVPDSSVVSDSRTNDGTLPGTNLLPTITDHPFQDPNNSDYQQLNFQLIPNPDPDNENFIDQGTTINWLFSDYRGSLRPIDCDRENGAQFDIGALEYSDYYGGIDGDQVAKAFEDVSIGSEVVVTNFIYNIKWQDSAPFPAGDLRIQQAGEYWANLALVDEHGRRIELGAFLVEVSQLGYTIPFTFGVEHIGVWRLRVELASDPNQFQLSEEFSIEYKKVHIHYLGTEIEPPEDADTSQKPEVEKEHLTYWSAETNRLFAIGPGTTVITWYADEMREIPIPVVAQLVYPTDPQIHIADTQPADLLPEGTRFDGVEKKYADNDASITGNSFSATIEGYAVLLFRDADAIDPNDKEIFEVVRTLGWNHSNTHAQDDPVYPIEEEVNIGEPVTDTSHNQDCGNGYVFFEQAFYDGLGEAGRMTGQAGKDRFLQ